MIIEEPEAHIYPLLQKRVMEFIVFFVNIQDSGVLVTRHSLYILTVANNLYYVGGLAENGQAKQVYNILIENPKSRLYNKKAGKYFENPKKLLKKHCCQNILAIICKNGSRNP